MNNSINQGIRKLKYDPATILKYSGDDYSNLPANEDKVDKDKYIVVHHEKKTVSQKNFDIAIANAINDRTYPGALLLANENLVNNMPSALYAKRAPITLRANLPGIEEAGTKTVNDPKYSTVSEAVNNITTSWLKNYAGTHHITTNCSYSESKVFSKDHLRVIVGFDLGNKLDLDFSAVTENKKQMFVLAFKQIFYTISVDSPEQPGDFFHEQETWENLTGNGVSNDAPPAFVANVAYGRSIYVTVQTSNMSTDFEGKLKLAIKNNTLNADVLQQSIFENSEYSAIVLGGDAEQHIPVTTKDFGEIEKMINENSLFTEKNQGAPISYTSVFLKENTIATINSSTQYVQTTYTEYSKGSVRLDHTGGYVAKFYVTWRERDFVNGVETFKDCAWEKNGDKVTSHFSTVIPMPANATNIHVKATENTGLAWEGWRTVVDEDVPLVPEVKVSIWGTTLHPKEKVEVTK